MSDGAFAWATAVAVLAAIVLGVATIGGPGEARRDRYDALRYSDLAYVSSALLCRNWRVASPVLPEGLSVESLRSYCGGVEVLGDELIDEETGQPYAYRRLGDSEFEVCAEFHDAERAARLHGPAPEEGSSFNPDTGCVTGRIR